MRRVGWTVVGLVAVAALTACGQSGPDNQAAANDVTPEPANMASVENIAAPDANEAMADTTANEAAPAAAAEGNQVGNTAAVAAPPAKAALSDAKAAPAVAAAVERPKAFAVCAACHSTGAGEPHRMGPNLHGVAGAKAGTRPGYNYSEAMRSAGFTWTPAQLDTYLLAPTATVPGTKMMFPGVKDEKARGEIIRYLSSLK
jgi:cytochrome c